MFSYSRAELTVFCGTSNGPLGQEIADCLGLSLGDRELRRFSDGEVYVRFAESVRGKDVFIIQSLCCPVNDNLVELLVMVDALKRASAARVSAVIPYYGYARQDKKVKAREPITARLVADLISVAGIDRVLTMDLHAGQIQGFFDKPVDHLTALPILSEYVAEKKLKNLVVVSPDVGRVKMAHRYAGELGAGLAILHKTRTAPNTANIMGIVGDVQGKKCLLVDDMIDTGGTILGGAEALMDGGAAEVRVCCTHPVFSDHVGEKLRKAAIKEVIATNTIQVPVENSFDKLKVLTVADLFARAISNIHRDLSVSELFRGQDF